jgi:hypothetical protein
MRLLDWISKVPFGVLPIIRDVVIRDVGAETTCRERRLTSCRGQGRVRAGEPKHRGNGSKASLEPRTECRGGGGETETAAGSRQLAENRADADECTRVRRYGGSTVPAPNRVAGRSRLFGCSQWQGATVVGRRSSVVCAGAGSGQKAGGRGGETGNRRIGERESEAQSARREEQKAGGRWQRAANDYEERSVVRQEETKSI